MKNILFRADSSSLIGTGHIMRDLVLSEQFKNSNIIFATQELPGNINHKIRDKHYTIETLKSNSIETLIELIYKHSIHMLIIDHYDIHYDDEKVIKEKTGVKIFVVDDTYEKHHCDILLNHNLYANTLKYKKLVPPSCELRCGKDFMLLREEFQVVKQLQHRTINQKTTILIIMGGADTTHININILKVLEDFNTIKINLVTTTANSQLNSLKKYINNKNNITLHLNSDKIAQLMISASFAIVTPSITVNEVIYLNTPFIAIKTVENQNEMYHYLGNNGYTVFENFNATLIKKEIQKHLSTADVQLINFLNLTSSEKTMVLQWRNDQNIRKWMLTQTIITPTEHLYFLESLKNRDNKLYLLLKQDFRYLGVIDFTNIDLKNRKAEFGIYANPNVKGMGHLLMKTLIHYASNTLEIDILSSTVLKNNLIAIKLYEAYGFTYKHINNAHSHNLFYMERNNENR